MRPLIVRCDRVDDPEPDASPWAKAGASAKAVPAAEEEEPGEMWREPCSSEGAGVCDAACAGLLGVEPPEGQLHHVRAAARAVIGGDEVAADP
jgi:hypothetical protein